MKALKFDQKLEFVKDEAVPQPKENEVLVRVLMAGICNTDIEISKGYMDFKGILGHEFVGCVESPCSGKPELEGRRVVGEINSGCGKCALCRGGLSRHCLERDVLGISGRQGCFAEYLILPYGNLFPVPDSLADEDAVFCEPVAAAYEITEQINISRGERVLVLGDGKLGQLIGRALQSTQAEIVLAGKHTSKLKLAAQQGLNTVLADQLGQRDFDVVVEATGSEDGFQTALRFVKPRGKVILKSTLASPEGLDLTPVVIDEITLIGSRCGPFGPALEALAAGLEVRSLISAVFPFDQALQAFKTAKQSESLKVLMDFQSSLG